MVGYPNGSVWKWVAAMLGAVLLSFGGTIAALGDKTTEEQVKEIVDDKQKIVLYRLEKVEEAVKATNDAVDKSNEKLDELLKR